MGPIAARIISSYEAKVVRMLVTMCCALALFGCDHRSPELDRGDLSSLGADKAIIELSIITPSGWLLRIKQDGSGQVGFGSLLQDFARFPTGTFEFANICDDLISVCVPDGSISEDLGVTFIRAGETSTTSKYFSDIHLARELFARAVGAADKTRTRLEELYRTKPPVPHEKQLKAVR